MTDSTDLNPSEVNYVIPYFEWDVARCWFGPAIQITVADKV